MQHGHWTDMLRMAYQPIPTFNIMGCPNIIHQFTNAIAYRYLIAHADLSLQQAIPPYFMSIKLKSQ